jgi:NADH-quinone oxidoreductase subunit G
MTTTDPSVAEEAPPPDPDAVPITINGVPHVARKGQLIIEAAADAGEYIPRFCYHERMRPVGKCRMCLVEADTGRGPAVTVSCMVPVAPDMKIDTQSPTTKRMQEGVLELLLANHPLDCPVCDKGGECPLQDQAFSHGPGESRYVEEKRHYEKPIPISDLVYLDRERCILCDRCTRFADEVAGDALIHFVERGNQTQVLTFPDEPFRSYFSGNTVQICPVGALTAKPYRFKARPWDLEEAESTCTTCSVGCRVVVQSSRDELVRVQGVDSDPVNWGWLCDRGRFDFESVGSDQRVRTPLVRTDDGLTETSWSAALSLAADVLREALASGGASRVAILGGARGTNEDAWAWARLASALGITQVDAQLGDGLSPEVLGLPAATIDEACSATTVVLLAPDLREELPVLYLRLRDAAARGRRLLEFTPKATGLTRSAWRSVSYEPGTQAAIVRRTLAEADVAEQLARGPVVVVVGRANLAEDPRFTLDAAAEVLAAVPAATVLPVLRRGNVRGALAAGLGAGDATDVLRRAAQGALDCLVLLGADPLSDVPDQDLARRAIAGVRRIIAIDTFLNETSQRADVVLPAAAWAEKAGTTTNLEGRVTALAQKVTVAGTSRPDWMIAVELGLALGHDLGIGSLAEAQEALAAQVPAFAGITAAVLAEHPDGVRLAIEPTTLTPSGLQAPERNSYDFRLVVGRRLYDRAVSTAMSPSLAPLAEEAALHVHPLDLDRLGAAEGSSVRVSSARTSVILPVRPDPSVTRGTVWAAWNLTGPDIGELIDAASPVIDVRVENL